MTTADFDTTSRNLNAARQSAYDRGDKAEVARLNVALASMSRPERSIDQIFADAMKRKGKRTNG